MQMKSVTTFLIMLFLSFPAWAETNTISFPEDTQYELWVDGSRDGITQTQYVHAASAEALVAADHASWTDWAFQGQPATSDCSVSITVKVRVGFDSNFVEASATVSGIPCDEVVEAIRNLKEQLLSGIK